MLHTNVAVDVPYQQIEHKQNEQSTGCRDKISNAATTCASAARNCGSRLYPHLTRRNIGGGILVAGALAGFGYLVYVCFQLGKCIANKESCVDGIEMANMMNALQENILDPVIEAGKSLLEKTNSAALRM